MEAFDDEVNAQINEKVIALTAKAVTALQSEQDRLGIKHTNVPSLRNIPASYLKKEGLISAVRFKIKRSGVFVEKGAGRGQGGTKGGQWKNKFEQTIRTNPKSLGKMNTGKRKAKEWFNPVIQNYLEDLAEQVATEFLHISYKKLKIK